LARSKRQKRRYIRKQAVDWPIVYPKKKPRLYLDEQLPPTLTSDLAEAGVDAIHATLSGYQGQADTFHCETARQLKRTLVTANWRDFWDDRQFPLHRSPGVIILDTGARQNWQRTLTLLLAFLPYIKTFVRGPFGGKIVERSKIRLTRDRIVWRILTFDGSVHEEISPWGPWW
jgi:predicted nuclease of predicted toxin-antitoxin system